MIKKIGKKTYNFFLVIDKSKTLFLLFVEIIVGLFLSISSVYAFTRLATNTLNNKYFNFDSNILDFFYSIRTPMLTKIMLFFTFLGKEPIILISFILVIYLIRKKYRHEAALFFSILVLGFILSNLLKLIIARERPFIHPLVIETFYSFPSGHTMNAFVFYTTLAFFAFRFTRKKLLSIFLSSIFLIVIILVGISRIYLGVHYPTDIIAGFIGGFGWFVTVLVVEKTIIFYKMFRFVKSSS